ncbi:MAG TPA: hypothetical protein DEF45_08560 [Rhodopirellula sp.]|nr:hypothetical protein [Rhodopirellula sp.]
MKTPRRRDVLRSVGVSLSLPFMPSAANDIGMGNFDKAQLNAPKRMVCIGNMLGFYPAAFWPENPKQDGKVENHPSLVSRNEYELRPTCKSLELQQQNFTLIQGFDHLLAGGHFAIHAFLSGVRQVDAKAMPTANMTIDQYAAEFVTGQTRYPTLTIGSDSGIHGGCQLAWTRSGTRVPPITGPQQLFQKLFLGTSQSDKIKEAERFELQASILDGVLEQSGRLQKKLDAADRRKLDEYLNSLREVEKRLDLRRSWVDRPKPKASLREPKNQNMVEDLPLLYDLILLALQTDSTRIATLEIGGDFNPKDLGIKGGYHGLSHHGHRPAAIESLLRIDQYQIEQFARFLGKLAATQDDNDNLLRKTCVLFGSGMGNANSHTNTNLPVVLAGGSWKHGKQLIFNPKATGRPPLTNLFVSMLQEFGAEVDQFATSTGTLRGLS